MIGWWIVVSTQSPEERDRADQEARRAAILAQWEAGAEGIRWIERLTREGKATKFSGGGYPTKTHAARVKVSPWCQQRLSGERTVCDTGEHDWQRHGEAEARCGVCGRVEQVQAELA